MTEQDAPNLGMLIALLREERDRLKTTLANIHANTRRTDLSREQLQHIVLTIHQLTKENQ